MSLVSKIHRFQHPVDNRDLPRKFTFPFRYIPHPLCREAAKMTQRYIASRTDWQEELSDGKMFGVLVVEHQGEVGFLAAFSGNLAGSNMHDYFVPPVYDMLQPGDFFKVEERNISEINRRIAEMQQSEAYMNIVQQYREKQQTVEQRIAQSKAFLKQEKLRREALRQSTVSITPEQEVAMTKESQFQKAEHHRLAKLLRAQLEELKQQKEMMEQEIYTLQTERKQRSAALQIQLFEQFRMRNANGEERTLMQLFHELPPSGSGECAAPKLLQYAYLNDLRPVCMAEFWWGASPKGEVREHGRFYPACQHKCGRILPFMLQGLDVEENPLEEDRFAGCVLEICWEDEDLIAIEKPSGMLSVPGKTQVASAQERLEQQRKDIKNVYPIHRLDMDTSGILLFAKNEEMQRQMRLLFEARKVHKTYVAELEGKWNEEVEKEGTILLPLSPDYEHRPAQKVDWEKGKSAVTKYKVMGEGKDTIQIEFYPETGRTHQLRVHAASKEGLHHPIVGDAIYGTQKDRLHLHAKELRFIHPKTGKEIEITVPLNSPA